MDTLQIWRAWYAAFEQSALDDQWERLSALLTPDAQYRVVGAPFACTLKGQAAIVAGFRKSFAGFDRKFDRRTHVVAGTKINEPGHVQAQIWGVYEKVGLPPMAFPAVGHWHIEEGRIGLMVDVYDLSLVEAQEALAWLGAHAEKLGGLDPSYA